MIYVNGRFLTQDITGVQRFSEEIIKELYKLRDDVIVLVPDMNSIKRIPHEFKIIELKGGRGHYWEQVTLPRFLNKNNKPFLLNLCSTAPAFYKNQIVTHHDITYVRFPNSYSWKFRLFYRILAPLMMRNCTKLVTVSFFSKKEIVEHYNIPESKVTVIYNGVGDEFSCVEAINTSSRHENYALAVSSPNEHKNFLGMIKAFSATKGNVKLKIIGSASRSFNSMDFSAEKDPRIEFLGRVTDSELINLYQNAKYFIFPSFYEGFGIPPLEAQACGCPVVSSDRASLKEVLKDSALFFDPTKISEMIKALEIIDSDNNMRKELVEKGIKNMRRFSWQISAEKLNSEINACIA
jgi:glycosyltransferase involved in cell wall biosynthesis